MQTWCGIRPVCATACPQKPQQVTVAFLSGTNSWQKLTLRILSSVFLVSFCLGWNWSEIKTMPSISHSDLCRFPSRCQLFCAPCLLYWQHVGHTLSPFFPFNVFHQNVFRNYFSKYFKALIVKWAFKLKFVSIIFYIFFTGKTYLKLTFLVDYICICKCKILIHTEVCASPKLV